MDWLSAAISAAAMLIALATLLFGRRDKRDAATRLQIILEERDKRNAETIAEIKSHIRTSDQAALTERVRRTEKDIQDLRDWKHLKIDPYVPGAIDGLKERVDRLDRKVFNGFHRDKPR